MGASTSSAQNEKKAKVEHLFRQNNRSNRSRSLDARCEKAVRPIGSSQSARYPKQRGAPNINRDHSNGSISGLSAEQKRALEVCWVKCPERQIKRLFEDIFLSILHSDEDLLKMFRLENVPRNKLRENEFFKSQAANFSLVINLVVTNLQENSAQACQALQDLGAQHVRYNSRGFQMMYWDVYTDCFERNYPPTFKTRFEREAWSAMILFILQQMKLGYTGAKKHSQSDHRFLSPARPL
ncbi:unnamed protein product, partial [Mesorhabditis spiculigera]